MKTITAERFVEGVESIYVEQPSYELGHDGSDGSCDCIGMVRGGLKRGGASDIKNLNGTNQAARKAIRNLQKLSSSSELIVGDVVLKTRDKDDKSMPLPDKYRKGGADYDLNVGETNFSHIGTVTGQNPLVITHMTSPTAKQDKSIKGWSYYGELPWIEQNVAPEPPPEPEQTVAVVFAENGKPVKMRKNPSKACDIYWKVPCGDEVLVNKWGDEWSMIEWDGMTGYMMTSFLHPVGGGLYVVTIPNLTLAQAQSLTKQYPGSFLEMERG